MPTDRELSVAKDLVCAVSKIQEAGLAPDIWPEALKSLTDALGIEGAACIVLNKRTRAVDWVCFSGLSAELETKYIEHYALLDPFSPLLFVLPGWTKLSECLPSSALQKSEWYNDFVLACGVRDALGTQLVDTSSHAVLFGLHRQIGRSFANETTSILDAVTGTLSSAIHRHMERLFGSLPTESARATVAEGARYFFHIKNGSEYPDQTGGVFANHEEAMAHASVLAAELKQDEDWVGSAICVADERGRLVARIQVG